MELSNKANDVVLYIPNIGEYASLIGVDIEMFASNITQEKNYISSLQKFIFLTLMMIIYIQQADYHIIVIGSNMDSLSNILIFLLCIWHQMNILLWITHTSTFVEVLTMISSCANQQRKGQGS